MLLSYTARITTTDEYYLAEMYDLPLKFKASRTNEDIIDYNHRLKMYEALYGLTNLMNSYLKTMIKGKKDFPLPQSVPPGSNDYDMPVALDIAFAIILKFFRGGLSQKRMAEIMGKSQAYLSKIESLELGVSLENASEMLQQLEIRAALNMLPLRTGDHLPCQTSPDGENVQRMLQLHSTDDVDVAKVNEKINEENEELRKMLNNEGNFHGFPAVCEKEVLDEVFEMTVWNITFPSLKEYNLDTIVKGKSKDDVYKRATIVLNQLLSSTPIKIKYPKEKGNIEIKLRKNVANKVFGKSIK